MTMAGTLTPRERVLAALRHERPDRTPRDFWAEPPAWSRLEAHLGTGDRDRILERLGIDVRHLDAPSPPERPIGGSLFENYWGNRGAGFFAAWRPL